MLALWSSHNRPRCWIEGLTAHTALTFGSEFSDPHRVSNGPDFIVCELLLVTCTTPAKQTSRSHSEATEKGVRRGASAQVVHVSFATGLHLAAYDSTKQVSRADAPM